MAKDRFHDVVRAALEKEGWRITADPFYQTFFQRRFIVSAVDRYQLRLVIYDVQQEVINQWL
ncbi:MAG: hypothetical protein HC786_15495 [Richelia sp. CSU_2_1]|nr:hypothetical protein [Richelia sp. CSU_2_1]